MSEAYKGDTHGKRLARLHFWMRVRDYFGDTFTRRRFCYLASHAGGDASILLALGVPPGNQMAIDRDRGAMAQFKLKYPSVPTEVGDVGDILGRGRVKYDGVFLDFCANISPGLVITLRKCMAHSTKHGSVFAYAVERARETGLSHEIARLGAENERRIPQALRGMFLDESTGNSTVDMVRARRLNDGRSAYVYNYLFDYGTQHRVVPLSLVRLTYQSRTRESPGSPMMIAGYWCYREPKWVSRDQFAKLRNDAIGRSMRRGEQERDVLLFGAEVLLMVRHARDIDQSVPGFGWSTNADYTGVSARDVVRQAAALDEDLPRVRAHALLNISPGSLAALRAHVTMGTYDKVAA